MLIRRLQLLRLLWELAWAQVLVRVATAGGRNEVTPESHLYLADLHFKLAAEYRRRHHWVRAKQHVLRANEHLDSVPAPLEPRPAAALAMPVPREPIFTDARGSLRPSPPDDVA